MKRYRKHSFTLIELLAVIGITALLIGIFAPAFSRMMSGGQVDQMASNFKTGMEVAQAKAVAANKFIAMILPNKYDEISDPKLKPFCGGGYRLAFVRKNGAIYEFVSWVPGSSWTNMADGAMVVAAARSKNWWDNGANDDGKNRKFKPLPSVAADGDDVLTGFGNLTGIVAKDSDDEDIKALGTADATTGQAANWHGIVFSPLGGCAGGETPVLFFITEAKYNGASYVYDNKDNFVVLKLNPITGKVSYLPMEDEEEVEEGTGE
jgi:type II secretory pathway pseudopilin PulG